MGVVQIAAKAKRGRPRKEWDASDIQKFKQLVAEFNTREDICRIFGVSEKTLNRLIDENLHDELKPDDPTPATFSDAFELYGAAARGSLRKKLFDLAMRGDKTALIFLSKNYLGMSDKSALDVTTQQNIQAEVAPVDDIISRLGDIEYSPSDSQDS